MIPFRFQKGNKSSGCEDAPPVSAAGYSVVCDGLGGSGSAKHLVPEGGEAVERTSAYLGSRIVSSCTEGYFEENYGALGECLADERNYLKTIHIFVSGLKQTMTGALDEAAESLHIGPSRSRTLKVFPTTLASALYYPSGDRLRVLAIWAGDSRVYVLSPSKGLQLLSVDDAEGASDAMNSFSAMNNCISAGNGFRLNYAFYEMTEPGIVFCCSDGCFDYMKSPLHFEWALLYTILERMPPEGGDVGGGFADSIRDNMYAEIGDDTTMSGVCFRIESAAQMKSLYRKRMDAFGAEAEKMNDCMKELKSIREERDAAKKAWRLKEGKAKEAVGMEVCRALTGSSHGKLYDFLAKLPCYGSFREAAAESREKLVLQHEKEVANSMEQLKKECKHLLICDYLKLVYESGGGFFGGSVAALRGKVSSKTGRYADYTVAAQVIEACMKVFGHADLRSVMAAPIADEEKYGQYVNKQTEALENTLDLLKNGKGAFAALWGQAFFSTSMFDGTRESLANDPSMDKAMENALRDPGKCRFASELTRRRIYKYQEAAGRKRSVMDESFEKKWNRQLRDIAQEFYARNREGIFGALMEQPADMLCQLLQQSPEANHIAALAEAREKQEETEGPMLAAQKKMNDLWEKYRIDYELFKTIVRKGEV